MIHSASPRRRLYPRLSLCLLLLYVSSLALGGCAGPHTLRHGIGRIALPAPDAGIYTIVVDDNTLLHPLNLPLAFQRDSLEVVFIGYERPEARIEGMEGIPFEIIRLTPVQVYGAATVIHLDTGEAYGLLSAEGLLYLPLAPLDALFQLDSLAVLVDLTVEPDSLADLDTLGDLLADDETLGGFPVTVEAIAPADTTLKLGLGTVVYHDFEGGFYGIVDSDGNRWLPYETLPEALRHDSLAVRFLYQRSNADVSIQMWGSPIDLLLIHAVADSSSAAPDDE